ncbi:hypothetical protein ACJX0J_007866 [Zea mays]
MQAVSAFLFHSADCSTCVEACFAKTLFIMLSEKEIMFRRYYAYGYRFSNISITSIFSPISISPDFMCLLAKLFNKIGTNYRFTCHGCSKFRKKTLGITQLKFQFATIIEFFCELIVSTVCIRLIGIPLRFALHNLHYFCDQMCQRRVLTICAAKYWWFFIINYLTNELNFWLCFISHLF